MFKERVITGIILIVLMVVAVLRLSSPMFLLLIGVVVMLAASEWAALNGLSGGRQALYAVIVGAAAVGSLWLPPVPLLVGSLLLWVWLFAELVFAGNRLDRGLFAARWSRMATGMVILVPAWRAVETVSRSPSGQARILLLLSLVAFGDIAAYVVGKPFGRTKIAPHVSPGKSMEGLAGAVIGVALVAYVCGARFLRLTGHDLTFWTLAAVALVLFSVVGDLTESRAKRIAGVKDSGRLLPGHGGVFDRIDGFTAAAPVYALVSLWLSRS